MIQDPVCGMQVEESEAKPSTQREGRTHYFCSEKCKGEFDRDPKRYLTQGGRPAVEEQAGPRT